MHGHTITDCTFSALTNRWVGRKILNILQADRIDLLVKTIKDELVKEYDTFIVKTIQLYYNDDYENYQPFKEENITDLVCI